MDTDEPPVVPDDLLTRGMTEEQYAAWLARPGVPYKTEVVSDGN